MKKLTTSTPFNCDYPVQSRIHPLRSFPKGFFVKRDDELGFGISGSKFRKYRTLIPHILQRGYRHIVVVGGPFSNNVLGLAQLLIENGLEFTLLLTGERPAHVTGNFLFLELLAKDKIRWVKKDALEIVLAEYQEEKSFIIPEGAACFEAFLGALTLPLDIQRNEEQAGVQFEHIFMEAGTGYSAAALLLGFAAIDRHPHVHLLHMAEDEAAFFIRLQRLHRQFEEWLQEKVPFPKNIHALQHAFSPSFGATSRALFDCIEMHAREEGFLLDPIYSAKLFAAVKASALPNGLIIHSGGALSLSGFQKNFC